MAKKDGEQQTVHQLVGELGDERYVVERIKDELKARGWSQSELSRRMEAEVARSHRGGVLHQGVLSKLLRGDRGRHVSIDQLITLSKVFEVPLGELLLPNDALVNTRGWRLLQEAGELQNQIRHLTHRYNEHTIDVGRMIAQSPALAARVREYRDQLEARLLEELDDPDDPTPATAYAAVRLNRYPILLAAEDALNEGEKS